MAADRLQIVKRIASGGMAELFLARQRGLSGVEKLVVVKQVLPQYQRNAEFLRMFEDEARINALLQHPNLVQMFELGSRDGLPFITMEFLHGEDVRSVYKALRDRGASMKLAHAMNIVVGVCAGLHYAHELRGLDGQPLRVVHRDISPQNVVVTFNGGVKVVDFGIARADNRKNETRSAVLKGKIAYMAPEQLRAEALDRRADIYAVGVLLYEMTTGQRPFRSAHEVALMRAVLEDVVPPPRKVLPGYPAALEVIVLKALAKNPNDRYQTAQELQSALEEFARSNGLLLSNVPLSKFMGELFGDREDLYREVLAGKRSVDELPLDALIGSVADFADSDSDLGAPSPQAAALEPLPAPERVTSAEHFEVERLGEVLVVRLRGKLNERFAGAELAKVLRGTVVVDVSKVERVTSFGVREWLQFLTSIERAVPSLYFVGCSEAFVNQLSMVKRFMGNGQVLSFQAPHHCSACDRVVPMLVDVATHAATLARPALPPCTCPGCGRQADFDDDVSAYLAFGPKPPSAVPAFVTRVVRSLGEHPPGARSPSADSRTESIEKVLEPTCTRVRVKGVLSSGARWAKVFDGLEGDVVLDLSQVQAHGDTAIRELTQALKSLGPETTSLTVVGARQPMVTALGEVALAKVESVLLDAPCARCGDSRARLVSVTSTSPVLCTACGCELDNVPADWRTAALGHAEPEPPAVVATPAVEVSPAPPPEATRHPLLIIVGTALAGVLVGGAVLSWTRMGTPAPMPTPVVAPPASSPVAPVAPLENTLPTWAAKALVRSDTGWTLVGRGDATSRVAGSQVARQAAAEELARALETELPDNAKALLKQLRARSGQPAPSLDPGSEAEQAFITTTGGVEVALRFELTASTVASLTSHVTRQHEWRGVTFINAPADISAEHALLVLAIKPDSPGLKAGLRPGDLVLEVAGAPVHTIDELERESASLTNKQVTCRVLADGVARALRVSP